ncbi:hypothetical protein NKR23_g485 [Pleurostoma richardsiae]|uniref:Small secreted protein n=1 Tax=Pleurostoma richardsiae TaxID=41990 RepID=A0AA38VQI9_9PEZI|nr:hypothetical protein NKR23_g485 [Pleurostoma richardsiae]
MYFSKIAVVFSLAASALALPTLVDKPKHKRAGVLTVQDYADFQISDGVAGNALAEVAEKFPIDESDLANVDPDDLDIIKAARVTAEAAETDAGGFNDALEDATGDAADALQVGKIKNKVLKLKLEVLALQIDQAINGSDNADKIAEEQTKLDKNVATDTASAGDASQSVDFQGDDSP